MTPTHIPDRPSTQELKDTVNVEAVGGSQDAPMPVSSLAPSLSLIDDGEENGPVLAGRYRLLALLGTGGMGSVYRVRDLELDEVVALKMIRRESLSAPNVLARFRQEVKLARRVTHKNVARTFDIGEHQNERFLTMEYVDGPSLTSLIDDNQITSTTHAIQIARSIAEGLAAAHEAGVIHLDLKPDNVMVAASNERVVITDFGIARVGAAGRDDGGGAGAISSKRFEWVGTPAYMAPEQVEGLQNLDARCDLYALGEVLFELLTGRLLWQAPNAMAAAAARLLREPENPCTLQPSVPAALGAVVLRLLARDREGRYATASDVIDALDTVSRERPTTTPTALSRPPPPPAAAAVAALSVAILPLRNEGPKEDDYIAAGISDDLIDTLSTTERLLVRPSSMVAQYKSADTIVDTRAIGRNLGVNVVVEGALRRVVSNANANANANTSFQLVIRALSVADGFQLWAQRFQVKSSADLLVVTDAAARAIAEALTTRVVLPAKKTASDPVAIELYLRAREELRRRGYGSDVDDAIPLLEEALRREPDEPNILAAYAIARSRSGQSNESRLLAIQSAERATVIAPHLAEGWRALAAAQMMSADFAGTIRACSRALECSPHLAEAHHLLGDVTYQIGLLDEAIHRSTLALSLDPLLRGPAITLSIIYALLGDFDRAEAIVIDHPSLREYPIKYVALGTRYRLAMWRRVTLTEPLPANEVIPELDTPASRVARFYQDCARGELDMSVPERVQPLGIDARQITSPMIASFLGQVRAEAFLFANDLESAIAAIEFSDSHGLIDLAWLDRLPLLDTVRAAGDARFKALRERVAQRAATLTRVFKEGYDFAPPPPPLLSQ